MINSGDSCEICCPECGASSWSLDVYSDHSECCQCGHRIDYIKSDMYDEDISSEEFRENKWEREW